MIDSASVSVLFDAAVPPTSITIVFRFESVGWERV